PDTVPAAAALLVAPDDVEALAGALRRLLQDAPLRRRMAAAAQDAAVRLPRWRDSAELFSQAIEAVR
ncbi:MAG: glycosyltransferase family 1 protein, partial [Variibacter sp.]|nr:glycosyltransferase family 1 protein [Variibacter sp.]